MRWIVCNLLWLSFATTVALADEPAEKGELSAKLSVKVDGPLLADFPLLFKLKMTNDGEKPIHFWCGGPGRYPSARYFTITLINEREAPRVLSLSNGQYEVGSGGHVPIEDSQVIPAVCGPVSAGKHVLVVQGRAEEITRQDGKSVLIWPAMKSEQIEIEVIEDREKLKEAEQAILNRAKQEPFAAHVSLRFGIDPIVDAWLKQLRATPKEIGFAHQLGMVERFPNGTDLILKEVCEKRGQVELPPKQRSHDPGLVLLVRRFKTEAAMEALLVFVDSKLVSSSSRELAVRALIEEFPQPKTRMRLQHIISDTNHPSHWMAIRDLTYRRDPLAIQALLKCANDKDVETRLIAVQALSWFRDDPRAKECLEKAKSDRDKSIQETVPKALSQDLRIRFPSSPRK